MRFGWLTAAAAAAVVAPAAQAVTTIRGSFNATAGEYSQVDLWTSTDVAGNMQGPTQHVTVSFSQVGQIHAEINLFIFSRMYNRDGSLFYETDNGQNGVNYGFDDFSNKLDFDISNTSYALYMVNGKEEYLPRGDQSYWLFYTSRWYEQIRSISYGSEDYTGVVNYTVTISNLPNSWTEVPEPATWALMILGFGAIGGALRRQAGATRKLAM